MLIENRLIAYTLLALLVALVVSFLMTPIVKTFAYKVGAIDVPKDARRMHKTPIPRLGGLAIFIGFMVSILLFVEITAEMRSILLGAVIIVVLGVVDDIMALPALLKFVVQIVAALIPATHGVVIQAFSNPNVFSDNPYWVLGNLSVPLTVLWIVAITNAVNLIDGLDGLANGVSAISATTMLVLALLMVFFSLLEGMAFRETGLREGHGNFTWAANSSSFVLWVVMAGIFLREFVSGLKAKTLSSGRKAAYAVGFALMGWHAASGVYYLYFLLSTGNAF